MTSNVQTGWHRAMEAGLQGRIALNSGTQSSAEVKRYGEFRSAYDKTYGAFRIEPESFRSLFTRVDEAPKFFLHKSLLDKLTRDEALQSIRAMHDAEVEGLPFPSQLVEFEAVRDVNRIVREMILIEERPEDDKPHPLEKRDHPYRVNIMRVKKHDDGEYLIMTVSTVYLAFDHGASRQDEAGNHVGEDFGTHFFVRAADHVRCGDDRLLRKAVDDTAYENVRLAEQATTAIMLLLRTRGVVQERVEPTKLNKSRKASKKTLIPTHTILRVGSVITCTGRTVNVDHEGLERGTRKPVRVHWRKGHTRMQNYGPRDRPEKKTIFIEAVLVNYVEGGVEPKYEAVVKW